MKSSATLLSALLLVGVAGSASAQYSIPWSKIAGGGGTSTGGVFALSGTIGQPDASPALTNGGFALTGGFWALPVAIQTEGAPVLRIEPGAAGTAIISWSPATPGFVLQEALSLSPAQWINSISGATNPVVVPAPTPTRFYRLAK